MKNPGTSPFLDSTRRSEALETLGSTTYDVLIIGGGITGAGIALDCASRGLRTALVEKQDYGAGTSSRSTKLIHGGLRYLKQFEIGLVAEVGRERKILHRNAPHLVLPEGMLLPIVKGGTFGWWGVSVGLWVYDLLAQVRGDERRKMLNAGQTLETEPLLEANGLQGSGLYSEYRTDDARLVMAVLASAVKAGAHCLNYLPATELLYENGRVCGAQTRDLVSGTETRIHAHEVVNAAGPWVDEVRKLDGPVTGKRLHHTKGVHLTVPHTKLPIRQSVYFDIPSDGRMMFAIPRGRYTYLGTTDTNYQGDPGKPYCTREDAEYLIQATNATFAGNPVGIEDIVSTWAGIRPLIHEDGKSPSELSRKDEIFQAPSRLITIAGGKLTGFRKMAQRVTELVVERLIERDLLLHRSGCQTDKIVLEGGDLQGKDPEAYVEQLVRHHRVAPELIRECVYLYGSHTGSILQQAEGTDAADVADACLDWSVRREGARTAADFLIRRMSMLYFDRDRVAGLREAVESRLRNLLGNAPEGPDELERELEAVVAFRKTGNAVPAT